MLEILALYFLTRSIGEIVEEKGRKAFGYKLLAVALLIGFEVIFGIAGAVLVLLSRLPELTIYAFALGGGALGGGMAYLIAKLLPPGAVQPPPMPRPFR